MACEFEVEELLPQNAGLVEDHFLLSLDYYVLVLVHEAVGD